MRSIQRTWFVTALFAAWAAGLLLSLAGCANCQERVVPCGMTAPEPCVLQVPEPEPPPPEPAAQPIVPQTVDLGDFTPMPAAERLYHDSSIILTPTRVIAPVGSEVVLLAGVCGRDNLLKTNERVEWMLDPSGVGSFVDYGHLEPVQFFQFRDYPRKVTSAFAIGATSRRNIRLTRGTPSGDDDVNVQRGQTWISVSSPVEGTSYVTSYARDVFGWDSRQQTARIFWVDSQWAFPPPAINPVGTSHAFVTTVTRTTSGSPVAGYRVRYEILDGPPAGFAPDGATVKEVATNDLGQAAVEIVQEQPLPGTNTVQIQVIRPPEADKNGERLVVGTGTTRKTWTAPQVSIDVKGPSQASLGAAATYEFVVTNPGPQAVRQVVVTHQVPAGLTLSKSAPEAIVDGNRLEWRLGDIGAGQTFSIELDHLVEAPGNFQVCATATSADALEAQDCVSTTVTSPVVDVSISGPREGAVGDLVTYEILVTNRGNTRLDNLVLIDRFDEGLEHEIAASPIETSLDPLEPGASTRSDITFRITKTGELCHRVEVQDTNGALGENTACLVASDQSSSPSDGRTGLTVEKTGPATAEVGEVIIFSLVVRNTGTVPLRQVRVVDHADDSLEPTRASEGNELVGNDIIWEFPTLGANQSITLEVECRCLAAANSCNRVTVTCQEGLRADDEACVNVRPRAASLGLRIQSLRNPVRQGNFATYDIRITNTSQQPDQSVVLEVTFPNSMTPELQGTTNPTQGNIQGRVVRFAPVRELRRGETVTFQVRALANLPGDAEIIARATSDQTPEPIEELAETLIVSGP